MLLPPTFLPKYPPLVHAGGEEDGRLGDAHQQVGDGQVDDEHVGRRPQAAAPAGAKTEEVILLVPVVHEPDVYTVSSFSFFFLTLCLPGSSPAPPRPREAHCLAL